MKNLELTEQELQVIRPLLIKAMFDIDTEASKLFNANRTDEEHQTLMDLSSQSAVFHFLIAKIDELNK